jgi:hypothetical protein
MANDKTIHDIQLEVARILRTHQVNPEVIEAVNAAFGNGAPTKQVFLHRVKKPSVTLHRAYYRCNVAFNPGKDYIGIEGKDGIDAGQLMWLAILPRSSATEQNLDIRAAVRYVGIRKLPEANGFPGAQFLPYPIELGVAVDAKTMRNEPGLYFEAYLNEPRVGSSVMKLVRIG